MFHVKPFAVATQVHRGRVLVSTVPTGGWQSTPLTLTLNTGLTVVACRRSMPRVAAKPHVKPSAEGVLVREP